jgi:Leucine-rich repeat (LRR) protein
MNKSTLRALIFAWILFLPVAAMTQETTTPEAEAKKIENYREQIRRLMGFLEFSLNTLGSPETSTSEKEVIINESYLKAFLNDKVQIEDDLDENREILTYKDAQAYLKDVDFFFKQATFQIDVQDIQSLKNDQGMSYFKVTANRNLQAITVDDQVINNNKTRYIEINLDEKEQVLKIASIYTTRLNEAQEMMAWWNGMPSAWKEFLGSQYQLNDSIKLSQVDFLNDTTFLFVHEIPTLSEHDEFVRIGNDSLLIIKTDTVLNETYDTIAVGKNSSLRMLKEITKLESLDISGNPVIRDLYPVDQMTELRSLNISKTNITDLFIARNLNKLNSLNISGTAISDLTPIQYNNRVREFYLDSTKVASLYPIQGFHDLEVLHINYSPIMDLQPIRFLDSLKDLRLDYSLVSDLTPVGDLVNLENLSLSGSYVDSLNSIQYLITLKRIYFENTKISSFAPLSKLEGLVIIDADQTQVTDLEPLGNLPTLEKVYCDQTPVTRNIANEFMAKHPSVLIIYESLELSAWWEALSLDWQNIFRDLVKLDLQPTTEQLHQLTLVSQVSIKGNANITSLDPLSKLINLKEIDASGTLISDLNPLSDLNDLQILKCSETRISTLIPLENLTNTEELDFSGTLIDSLSGLQNLTHLITLNIDRTGVDDLKPLQNCRELQVIYCDNTKVGKADIDHFLDLNTKCLIVYQTSLLKSWWNALDPAWKTAFRAHTQLDDTPTREQLHTLASLTAVDLTGNRGISSLQPLTTLHRLEDLNLSNGALQDISPLADLVRLKKINLSGNPVEDLLPVSNLPGIVHLDISNTAVLKLDPIAGLVTLQYLNCSGTQIKKLDPLVRLVKLEKLECYNTEISSLKPLTGLVRLKQLVCYNTKLNEKKIVAFKEIAPGVEVVFY